jgi:iron complex transport system substrate-binding protein
MLGLALLPVLALLLALLAGRADAGPPRKVVSMNLCTDQLALLIAYPGQLYSVSYVSHDPATSPLASVARAYRPNHGLAEEIFLMHPDLVLAGAYTRRQTTDMLTRLGFDVETFAPAASFDDIRANIRRLGHLLDRVSRAEALVTAFDAALARPLRATGTEAGRRQPLAALYDANSYTFGRGTLAADILSHANLDNLATILGLGGIVRLPLELIVYNAPDLLITGDAGAQPTARAGAALTHPALRRSPGRTFTMDNRWACGTPIVLDIVRELDRTVAKTPADAPPKRPAKG